MLHAGNVSVVAAISAVSGKLYFLEIANKFYISEEVASDPRYRSSTVKLFLWETCMFNQGIKPYTLGMIT